MSSVFPLQRIWNVPYSNVGTILLLSGGINENYKTHQSESRNSDQAPYVFMSEVLPIQPIYLVYHFTPSIKIYTDSCLYISISLSKEEEGGPARF